jgi:hypothetical protein
MVPSHVQIEFLFRDTAALRFRDFETTGITRIRYGIRRDRVPVGLDTAVIDNIKEPVVKG